MRVLLLFTFLQQAFGAYYDVLPKGVRTLVGRRVTTDKVRGMLDNARQKDQFQWNLNLNSELVSSFSDGFSSVMDQVQGISPEAYDSFTGGDFTATANAEVKVNALGVGFGITDRLTVYGFVPYYRANVNVQINQVRANNAREVTESLDTSSYDTQVLKGAADSLGVLNANSYQSIWVNMFGYQPIGDWDGEGFGDTEVGMIYQIAKKENWGLAATAGVVAPTGMVERTDVVQDFSFGDGQWDAFVEFGGGYNITPIWEVDSWARVTYQAPTSRDLRIPESIEFPFSSETDNYDIKLGNTFRWSLSSTYALKEWFSIRPEFIFFYKQEDDYQSSQIRADQIFENNTESRAEELRLSLMFSTISLYLSNDFAAPLDFVISGQTVIGGQNTPEYTRYDIELRLYF